MSLCVCVCAQLLAWLDWNWIPCRERERGGRERMEGDGWRMQLELAVDLLQRAGSALLPRESLLSGGDWRYAARAHPDTVIWRQSRLFTPRNPHSSHSLSLSSASTWHGSPHVCSRDDIHAAGTPTSSLHLTKGRGSSLRHGSTQPSLPSHVMHGNCQVLLLAMPSALACF
jgi:hypothetical protein